MGHRAAFGEQPRAFKTCWSNRHGVSPAAVPERRGLREAGAEDGGDAEEDKGADVQRGLPRLLVDILFRVSI